LSGTATPGAEIHIFVDGKEISTSVSVGSDGKWTYTLSGLSAGAHIITVQVENSAGVSEPSNPLTVTIPATPDSSAPVSSSGGGGGGCGLGGLSASVWLALLVGLKYLRLLPFQRERTRNN
jgi:hypothetical protein